MGSELKEFKLFRYAFEANLHRFASPQPEYKSWILYTDKLDEFMEKIYFHFDKARIDDLKRKEETIQERIKQRAAKSEKLADYRF